MHTYSHKNVQINYPLVYLKDLVVVVICSYFVGPLDCKRDKFIIYSIINIYFC